MTWVATGTATLTAAEIAAAEAAAIAAAEVAASTAAAEAAAAAAASGASTAASTAAATEAAATTTGAITSAVPEVASAVVPEAAGITAVPEAAVVPEAATVPQAAAPSAVEAPAGINQVANVPSNVMSDVGVNPDFTAWKNAIDTNQFVPQDNTLLNAIQNVNAPTTPTSYTPEQLNQLAQSQGVFPEGSPALPGSEVTGNASLPANTVTPPAQQSSPFMQGFSQFAKDNPFTTAMLGYGALSATGAFNANAGTAPSSPSYANSPTLSKDFKGGPYTQPNIYKPRYASGGITSIGPVERMGAQNVGNQFYPQGQQDTTQFATPSQMPTSAEVVRSDYDPRTGAYTGQMNMASGGIAGYRRGGQPDGVPQVYMDMMDPAAKYRTTDTSSSISGKGIVSDDDPDTKYSDALTAALTRQAKIDKRANYSGNTLKKPVTLGSLRMGPTNTQEAASGGIMGYSLGGYAAGGNPRLLKGPGDGMSDNIPATIGGRQPARLADGEFVVPADVVSHLGNGSTDAGAKKLHGMMDKVRMDRTGKKKQAPAVNPNKYLPKK